MFTSEIDSLVKVSQMILYKFILYGMMKLDLFHSKIEQPSFRIGNNIKSSLFAHNVQAKSLILISAEP